MCKLQIQNKILFLAVWALTGSLASAQLYIENGLECRDPRPTLSVGDLVEVNAEDGQAMPRGPHIYLHSQVLRKLIKLRYHKAGEWLPLKAKKLAGGVYEAEVTNDFRKKFRYIVSPVAGDLQLEIWSENLETMLLREIFKNCAPTR